MHVRHKYVTNITLDASASTAYFVFGANCLYDTDISGSGHQPSNFDLMTQIYRNYLVTEAKFSMSTAFQYQHDTSQTAYWGFIVNEDSTIVGGSTASNDLMEQPYCQYAPYPCGLVGTPPVTLTGRIPIATWFGVKPSVLQAGDENRGTSTTNPARKLYVILWSSPVNGNAPPAGYNFRVELEYQTLWTNPVPTDYS